MIKNVLACSVFIMLALSFWPLVESLLQGKQLAKKTTCQSNLKQVATALQIYVQDYDDRLPPHAALNADSSFTPIPYLLHPYLKNHHVWKCLSDKRSKDGLDGSGTDTEASYGYNWHALSPRRIGVLLREARRPAETVAFVDSFSYLATSGPEGGTGVAARHQGGVNVAWLDGHVKFYERPEAITVTSASENGKRLKPGIDSYPLWNLR